jgi:hypothetical protein
MKEERTRRAETEDEKGEIKQREGRRGQKEGKGEKGVYTLSSITLVSDII